MVRGWWLWVGPQGVVGVGLAVVEAPCYPYRYFQDYVDAQFVAGNCAPTVLWTPATKGKVEISSQHDFNMCIGCGVL